MSQAASRPGVEGVLFDVDDTLVATREAFGPALSQIARHYLPGMPPERDDELVVMWRSDRGDHYAAYTRGELGYAEQRMHRANDLHAAFDGPVLDDAGFAAWDEVFGVGFRDAWTAHDDALAVVTQLLAAGLAVGALSNAAVAFQSDKLERTGLAPRVPMLVGVDTLGYGKPHPDVFVEACRRLGTDPSRTAYVGDELDVDAVAACSAGLIGIWLDRPGGRRNPISDAAISAADVTTIASLHELPAVLGLSVASPATRT